jgi:pimeloyl-ACP methyl ester carboxylesterase
MPDPVVTLRRTTNVFYLHGFASSPRSTKAEYIGKRLLPHGITLRTPDFNLPEFATMTMTRMLDQLTAELAAPENLAESVALIGSSLGGTLAILAAARLVPRVDRVVLLAPAVMFAKPGHHLLPPERIDEWRRKGAMPFFHHGYHEDRLLNYEFFEDTSRHDVFEVSFSQPTLIFQGLRDASVDFRTVEAFARPRPNTTLSLLDDEHQLTASLPRIWDDVEPFLGLVE